MINLVKRHACAVSDLEDAAFGHLRGEDWDSEMAEALGEMRAARDAIKAKAISTEMEHWLPEVEMEENTHREE